MFKMKLYTLLFFTFLSFGSVWSQERKINLKAYNTSFSYQKDSVCLKKKEIKKILISTLSFLNEIESDNFEGFLNSLSDSTLNLIHDQQLKRKFKKYKAYGIHMNGKQVLRSISIYTIKRPIEKNQMYTIVFSIPQNTEIKRRVGFDPIKHQEMEDKNHFMGLILTKQNGIYKTVIPW